MDMDVFLWYNEIEIYLANKGMFISVAITAFIRTSIPPGVNPNTTVSLVPLVWVGSTGKK